jgi:hypothetical protein
MILLNIEHRGIAPNGILEDWNAGMMGLMDDEKRSYYNEDQSYNDCFFVCCIDV